MSKKQELIKQYRRIRKNVLSNVRRLSREGYLIDLEIPKIPKRITESSIRNISRYTPDYLRSKSDFLDVTTGEVVDYTEREKIRQLRREQRSYIKIQRIINVIYEEIEAALNFKASMIIKQWFDSYRMRMGDEYVAEVITKAAENGVQFEINIYASDEEAIKQQANEYIERIMAFDDEYGVQSQELLLDALYEEGF